MGHAIGIALQASSRDKRVWQAGDSRPRLLTPENRHPMLPRRVPPLEAFQA